MTSKNWDEFVKAAKRLDKAVDAILAPPIKERAKKVRCKCVRCGKINYLPAAGTDLEEAFLCEPCDDKFIRFINKDCPEGGFVYGDPLARFLKRHPCRTS